MVIAHTPPKGFAVLTMGKTANQKPKKVAYDNRSQFIEMKAR
jgi:hypothetical protein